MVPHQFYLKSDIFKNNSKCFQLFGLHLLKIVTKTFQKYSNPVTLQFYGTIFFYLPMLLLKLTENYDKF